MVAKEVPAGTRVSDLASYLETRQLPAVAVIPGAVQDLSDLPANNLASTSLQVGEQVLSSRFVRPEDREIQAPVIIPEGSQLVSVKLAPDQVVGSQLSAGDFVGVILTVDSALPETGKSDTGLVTKTAADGVLVVRVQGVPAARSADQPRDENLPNSEVIVTLAVDTPLAERIVYTQNAGKVWLTLQQPTTNTGGSKAIYYGNVIK